MKRALPVAAAFASLALIAPGQALASHHHHAKLSRHHHHLKTKRHAGVHFVHFAPPSGAAVTTPTPTSPPAAPTTPTPTPTPTENAGTVTSFSGGVLMLTLNDKTTVTGKVTNETRIACVSSTPSSNGDEDDNSQGNEDQGNFASHGDWMNGGGDGGFEMSEESCSSSLLVAGAMVRFAELRIGPAGAEFETVVLVTAPKTPSTPSGGGFGGHGGEDD